MSQLEFCKWIALAGLLTVTGCEDDGDAEGGGSGTADESGGSSGGGGDYAFATDAPAAYTRVDRNGMPAINTAVIVSKDDYNAADPADDANGDFVPEITASIEGLHTALDDDLMGLGLTPCAPADCVTQGAPLVVPDTIKIDPAMPAGFPNGRTPTDPVIDLTLAVVLLDLTVHEVDTLAGVPVNPPANDKEFLAEFPYLAAPHEL
jgi:Domain of unknown function (DUF4331)